MDEEILKEIRKIALQNAFEHEGKTQDKIILAKILGTKPEFRTKVKEITGDISKVVSSVNQLSLEEQQKEIEENFPEILIPKKGTIKKLVTYVPKESTENVKNALKKRKERLEKLMEWDRNHQQPSIVTGLDLLEIGTTSNKEFNKKDVQLFLADL